MVVSQEAKQRGTCLRDVRRGHCACQSEEVLRDPVRARGCEVRQAHVDCAGQGIIWQNCNEFSKLPSPEHLEPELGCEAAPCSGSDAPILAGNHGVDRANCLARLQHGRGRRRFSCTDTLRQPGEHGCRRRLHAGDALPEEGRSLRNAGNRRFVPRRCDALHTEYRGGWCMRHGVARGTEQCRPADADARHIRSRGSQRSQREETRSRDTLWSPRRELVSRQSPRTSATVPSNGRQRGPPVGRGPPAQVGRGPPVELERRPPS
jgi:hypothetical protein